MSRLAFFRPLMLSLVAAGAIGLAACGSGSPPPSGSGSGSGSGAQDLQTRAELGCEAVAGPLDALQTPLSNTLAAGLSNLPGTVSVAGDLVTLVIDTLDLVDSLAAAAGTLNPGAASTDTAALQPVLDQALCTTAAVGEALIALTLDVTTPLADIPQLNALINTVIALQTQLLTTVNQLSSGGTVPAVALVLQQVTNTLGGVLASPLGLTSLPGGQALAAVLAPVSGLLIEVSGSMSALAEGDEQTFVDDLLGSVSHLVENLAAGLGPLGVVLTTVVNALAPVVNLLDTLLTNVLGLLV
ncbi:MAG: hypothetical protein ACT4PZ_00620 [Panacagrimonas sp.]